MLIPKKSYHDEDGLTSRLETISLSVITPTLNSEQTINFLIGSLNDQSDHGFTWIITDGGSDDKTIELINKNIDGSFNLIIDQKDDFGIYDAINRGVKISKTTHYIVVGSDDKLNPCAIEKYKKAILNSEADLVTADFDTEDSVIRLRQSIFLWKNGAFGIVTGHSVGLCVRKRIHDELGYYSSRYPIVADQDFILRCYFNHQKIHYAKFNAGFFNSSNGTSGKNKNQLALEQFLVMTHFGFNFFIQLALLFLRIARNGLLK